MKNCKNCGAKNSDPNQNFCTRKCKDAYCKKMSYYSLKKNKPSARIHFGVAFDYEGNEV